MQALRKYLLVIIVPLIAMVLLLHTYLLTEVAGLSYELAITDAVTSTAMIALAVWPMLLILNTYPTRVGIVLYALAVATLFSFVACFGTILFLKWFEGRDQLYYREWVDATAIIRYIYFWVAGGWVATVVALDKKARDIQKKFAEQADAAALLREAELYKLRQQLQPHFLYNSLNSISALTMIEPAKAQEMIGKLSDFLRSSVKKEAQDVIPIEEELQYIESYLTIESIRFGDRLTVQFENNFNKGATIPPFLLQPLLENAIKFGLYGKTGNVIISVSILSADGMLVITVINPFDADGQQPRGTGFGLKGLKRRLYLLYARTDLLETHKEKNLFTTVLKIPQGYVQGNID